MKKHQHNTDEMGIRNTDSTVPSHGLQHQQEDGITVAGEQAVVDVEDDCVIPIASAVLIDQEVEPEDGHQEAFHDEHTTTTTGGTTPSSPSSGDAPSSTPPTTLLRVPGEMMGLPAGETVVYHTVQSSFEINEEELLNNSLLRH